jgi:uncharacterized OB-fold protein
MAKCENCGAKTLRRVARCKKCPPINLTDRQVDNLGKMVNETSPAKKGWRKKKT